jgi:peptidoglycan hydrolase CwlO-like protein
MDGGAFWHFLTIGVTVLTSTIMGVGFVWAIRVSVQVLDSRLNSQDKIIDEIKSAIRETQGELKSLTRAITEIALQTQRQDQLEVRLVEVVRRVEEFERWARQLMAEGLAREGRP